MADTAGQSHALSDCYVTSFMLDTQYRMHPALAEFPSDFCYGGRLKSGVGAEARPALKGFQWPVGTL